MELLSHTSSSNKQSSKLLTAAILPLFMTLSYTGTAQDTTNHNSHTIEKTSDGLAESQRKNYREINISLIWKLFSSGKINPTAVKALAKTNNIDNYIKATKRGIDFGEFDEIDKEMLWLIKNALEEASASKKKDEIKIDNDFEINLD